MKAIIIKEFGKPENLEITEVAEPLMTDDQLLVKIKVAGLNPVDTKIRAGQHVSCKHLQLPAILGRDMSGVIELVGKNVGGFKKGDEVFGCIDKTYAEYVVSSPESLVKKPENVSFEEAGAIALAGLTAYQAINQHLNILAGQRVLIQSAAGGVGHLAVQFAKLNGAIVYGTASGKNTDFLKRVGVDQPINYKEERFEEIAKDLDAVLDTMGGETLYRSIKCVKPGGRVVCLPSSTKDDPIAITLAKERNVELIWSMMQPKKDQLELIAELLKEGKLKVEIEKAFQIDEIILAHHIVESHGIRGKVIIQFP